MTRLRIFSDQHPQTPQLSSSVLPVIQSALASVGVSLERWRAEAPLSAQPSQEEVGAAYRQDIERLMRDEGYQSWDVVSMQSDHPNKTGFRNMFLAEHRHAEDEVRFFVRGQGLFSLHLDGRVFEVLCRQGDLIRVPAGTPHWFDMGPNPHFTAIRLFNNPAGWVARFSGSDIAQHYSRLNN